MGIFYDIIKKCTTGGKNKKVSMVGTFKDRESTKELFRLMLCPSIIYNIKKVPDTLLRIEPLIDSDAELVNAIKGLIRGNFRGRELKSELGLITAMCSSENREVLSWIIARKNPAKIGKTIVNTIWPDLIRTQAYMGAIPGTDKALERLFKAPYVNVQTKEDGMCILIEYKDGKAISGHTRQGNEIGQYFPEFMSWMNNVFAYAYPDQISDTTTIGFNGMVHHELFCGDFDRKTGNGFISKQVKNGTVGGSVDMQLHSVVLDMYDYDDPDLCQGIRYENLRYFKSDMSRLVHQVPIKLLQDAKDYAQSVIQNGGEGVICKDPEQPFKNGKPWFNVKIKNEFVVELIGRNIKPHSTQPELIGAVLMESSDGLLQVWVTPRCMGDRAIEEFFWINNVFEVMAESVIVSKNNKVAALYLPRFNGTEYIDYHRSDKTKADTYQEILDQEAMSKGLDPKSNVSN